MIRSRLLALFAVLLGLTLLALLLTVLFGGAAPTSAQAPEPLQVIVGHSIQNDTSPPLRAIKAVQHLTAQVLDEVPLQRLPKSGDSKAPQPAVPSEAADAVVQDQAGVLNMPSPMMSFEGITNVNHMLPPDTQGDIGYDPAAGKKYYVQWINLSFAIWDVTITPTRVLGPVNGNTLWSGFGGPCETTNHGDPITLFDSMAQRWLMSQFALPNFPNGPFYQCLAISASANPLGAWHRYAFLVHSSKMNDYPKFGVWPDGYYMSVNQFAAGSLGWGGVGVFVFDRPSMLVGAPATFQYFDLYGVNPAFGGMLPSDLDGPTLPPPGSPNYFAEADDSTWIPPVDALRIWEFHVDWTHPASSTFGIDGQPNITLTTTAWSPLPCTNVTRSCIPQPGTSQRLDALGDRLMYRLAYRNFGSHESLVVNHTVWADGVDRAGIRWYEIRDPGGVATIYQQGTYAPADGEYRWMGSIAMDHTGNVALGYSLSSANTYPSIRYTGRLADDPLGALPQGETTLVAGSGSQTHSAARWGDYSMLGIDPVDDCTFWYTSEYLPATSLADWHTRIGSFKFPSCTQGPHGSLTGVVSDASNGGAIGQARVQATASPTQTSMTTSGDDGAYSIRLPVGRYDVMAAKYGYRPASIGDLSIISGTTTTLDIALTPATFYVVSGTVRDAATGWPLYARIDILGYPGGTVWNDPVTGFYSVTLAEGITYTFSANAWVSGYHPAGRALLPLTSDRTENFELNADNETCHAPGYAQDLIYFEDFELDNGAYTITGTIPSWEWGAPTSGPGAASSGDRVWATNLSGNYNNNENGYLISPNIDLSAHAGKTPVLTWRQWLQTEGSYDFASVEVSDDGGGSWTRVYGEVSGDVDLAWTRRSVALNPTYAVSNFRVRFRLRSDSIVTRLGWYLDDIGIAMVATPPATSVYSEDFELDRGGYITSTTTPSHTTSWEWGTPSASPGPGAAHSGVRIWATNLITNYDNGEDGYLTSPNIDLSASPGQVPTVAWWQWLHTEAGFDFASLEVSNNSGGSWARVYGGGPWTRVYGEVSGTVSIAGWAQQSVTLDPSYADSDFRVRFRLRSDFIIARPGWYVDDVSVSVAPRLTIACAPQAGGLVVGNVYDANTAAPLSGARVSNDGRRSTLASATTDPAVADSFYTLFSPAGSHTFSATLIGGYGPAIVTPSVIPSGTIRQDFHLPAGYLAHVPSELQATLDLGASAATPFTLTNSGGLAAPFELLEIKKGFLPTLIGPYHSARFVVKPFKQSFETAQDLGLPPPPFAPPYAAGEVIQSWSPGLVKAWGIAYDGDNDPVWVASPSANWGGNNTIYEYTPAGLKTTRSHPFAWNPPYGPADAAFNWNTGMLWIMNVDTAQGNNCIYELDPAAGYTGDRICPGGGFSISQRGLAYDPDTDTWFAGSWNDGMIHRFDSNGAMLADVNVGLAVAGLAYNPDTQHLFVMTNANPNLTYVLDVADNYVVLGQFSITGINAYDGAGLEIDCDGNLWAVNQFTQVVYEVESGETTSVCASDVPWLSESPVSGTLAVQTNQSIAVTFDAGVVDQPGQYRAQLKIKEDTPYRLLNVPVTMTVNPPPTWGQAHGRVYSRGHCDETPSLLTGAKIDITYGSGVTQTFTQGTEPWSWWAPAGPMTITASANNHVTQTLVTQIVAGQGINHDLDLRWLHNCGSVSPAPLDLVAPPNVVVSLPINLVNRGALPWTWSLAESASWLSISGPAGGVTDPDSSLASQITIDTTGMSLRATHTAVIAVTHDDDLQPNPLPVLVRVQVANVPAPLTHRSYLPVVSK